VVEPDVTGLLVPPQEPGALAGAMLRLARSPDLRQRFGAHGRRQAPERFGTGRLVQEIATLYEQVLAERRGAVRRAEVPLVQ
jgi:glycosyltransferase involved in cell wall biosynthesis